MNRRNRRGRAITGVLVLDKPQGWTSGLAVQKTKRLFGAAKVGHTGSLDQLATGVLPLCFGEATKLSGFLLNSDKTYEARFRLGIRTDSGDAEGQVIAERSPSEFALDESKVNAALDSFRGEFEQLPPMFSAVKRQGQRLYKLARKGIEVERDPRRVHVYDNTLVEFNERELALHIRCSKGTYVRAIADELGELLGCGAHVAALRRTGAGPFALSHCVTFEALREARCEGHSSLIKLLRPSASMVQDFPQVSLTSASLWHVRHGQPVMVPRAPSKGWVRLHGDGLGDNGFIGVGEVLEDGRIAPRRLLAPDTKVDNAVSQAS